MVHFINPEIIIIYYSIYFEYHSNEDDSVNFVYVIYKSDTYIELYDCNDPIIKEFKKLCNRLK